MLTLDTKEIAQLAGLSRKHVTNRVVTRPDFPKPVVWLSRQTRRWAQADILAYFRGEPRSAPPTLGSTSSGAGSSPDAH
jgi:predicted DNA-binding transcriptional regulator AlpA